MSSPSVVSGLAAMLDALETADLERRVREDNLVAAMVRDVPMTPDQIRAYRVETERRFREAVRRAGIPDYLVDPIGTLDQVVAP